jgi:hypothetical protein
MTEWDKLYVRVDPRSGWSHYRAWASGIGIEFSGATLGYAKDVETILRRMIKAPWEPPDVVVRTAKLVFEHIEHYLRHVDVMGDDFIGTAVDYEAPDAPYASFTLYIDVETQRVQIMDLAVSNGKVDLGPPELGWVMTFIAKYEGYDGYGGDGEHEVRRRVGFKGRVDSNVVWNEMMRVIRHAVNAMPTYKALEDA